MKHIIQEKISKWITNVLFHKAGTVGIILLLLTAFSVWEVQKLKINYNQIDLLPKELPSVKATNELINMVGGVGYLILALKGENIEHLKAVSDDIVPELRKIEGVQDASCKQDIEFIQRHIPYYIQTGDLEEAYRRLRKKIRSVIQKENPFSFSLSDETAKDEPLNFDDIIDKYKKNLDKRGIDDPYFIDKSKEMLLIMIQPNGNPGDIEFSEKLISRIQALLTDYNSQNKHKAILKEEYRILAEGATVTYGFTGDYKNNIDDAKSVSNALAPTSIVAFTGILFLLFIFVRKVSQVSLLMTALAVSILMTYAFCQVVIGELNTITVVLGAILMGFGIDYGLYFIFRLREEYTLSNDLKRSIHQTLKHAGSASLISAIISASSFYILSISKFKGFSDFGLMAGTGVLISAFMMYISLPLIYVLIDRVWPKFKDTLIDKRFLDRKALTKEIDRPFPFVKRIITTSLILSIILFFFASKISFDYDGRSFMTAESHSIILQEEVTKRFNIASDPVVIYTKNIKETKDVYNKLMPLPENSTVDSVLSIFTLVPPMEQQLANRKILNEIENKVKEISPDMLDEGDRKNFLMLKSYLKVQPFTINDVPKSLVKQFKPMEGFKGEGYLTYIFPGISVWDGRELIRFADEVGEVKAGEKSFYAAGGAVLFADLAKIVINDGKKISLITIAIVLLILIISFRNLRAVAFSMMPLVIGIGWMLGLMAMTGWKINFVNIVVFPVVFGYGVSLGVYIYERYLETGSVYLSVQRTGAAIAASSLTTLIGWAALLAAKHNGLKSMGILASFGIAAAMITTFTILPALLELASKKHMINPEIEEEEVA
jgi:predicted RND superfamily exporter protein